MLPITITICATVVIVVLIVARGYGERVLVLKVLLADTQRLLTRTVADLDAARVSATALPALQVGATVAVHLPGGEMVRGTHAGSDASSILVDHAELVAGGSVQPLGGRQHLARSYWTQELHVGAGA